MSEFSDADLTLIHQAMVECDLKAPQSLQHQELMFQIQKMLNCKHGWNYLQPDATADDHLYEHYCLWCGRQPHIKAH